MVRKFFIALVAFSLVGCSLYQKTPPIFVPPVGYTTTPETSAPNGSPTEISNTGTTLSPTEESEPTPTLFIPPTDTPVPTPNVQREPILYRAQAGDSLSVVATHFGVSKDQIQSNEELPEFSFINPGTMLVIPQVLINTTSNEHLLPDSGPLLTLISRMMWSVLSSRQGAI
jgi:LysM repeat protein